MYEFELYEGLIYTTPKAPAKSQILNYRLSKESQKWIRPDIQGALETLSEEEEKEFAFDEDRKCSDGVWFYNNGLPTYITGDHYFYLTHFKIDSGYPQYRDRDKRWFYHWALCDIDENCIGQCYGKLRRDGYSFRVDALILNRARKTFDSNYGIISKSGIDAQEMFSKLVHGFLHLPEFFKPQVQSAEDVKKKLTFRTPQQRVTLKNRKTKKEISLNTNIDFRNTKENSYDGLKIKLLAADESGKWDEVNVEKWYNIAKTCVTLGSTIIGKIAFGSTVNESTKGGANFFSIWKKSSVADKTEETNNRTGTGLWRYFVPAFDGIEGFIDEYGMSVIDKPDASVMGIDGRLITDGAKPYYERERKKLLESGDIIGYYEELRQRPFTEDEMFRDPSNENTQFDLDKIYQQINNNNALTDGVLTRGSFSWKGGVRDSEVVWNHDANGRWLISWLQIPEKRNASVTKFGQRAPANIQEGLFSVDPFDHKYTASKKRSNAASHGIHKQSFTNPSFSKMPVCEYLYRPTDPYILYEDMLMQCVFYGWQILGESNKPGCINYFRNRGYEHYLMDRPAFTHTEFSEKNQKEKWIPNTGDADKGIRRMFVEYCQSYVYENVGISSATGLISNFLFNRTLDDLAKFDVEKWTDYDLSVSFMIGVIGLNDYSPKRVERTSFLKFDTYDTRGGVLGKLNE